MSKDRRTSNEELLQMGINAAKNGQKDGARVLFRQVYRRDQRNERAMLWLARLAKTPAERQQWLRRVLNVNPANETALEALKKMQSRSDEAENRVLRTFGLLVVALVVIVVVAILIIVLFSQ